MNKPIVGETYFGHKVLSGSWGSWEVQCVLCGMKKIRRANQIMGAPCTKVKRCQCQVARKTAVPKVGEIFGDMEVVGPRVSGEWLMCCKKCNREVRRKTGLHFKQCGCTLIRHPVGEIINGRKIVVGRPYRNYGSVTVECLSCGAQAQMNPSAKRSSRCRNCKDWNAKKSGTLGEIYAIVCPYTGDAKYVGSTCGKSYRRVIDHFRKRNAHDIRHKPLYQWLQQLAQEGAMPGTILLEKVEQKGVHKREIFWIQKLKTEGCQLLNVEHVMEIKL